jgi:hypothetical protein
MGSENSGMSLDDVYKDKDALSVGSFQLNLEAEHWCCNHCNNVIVSFVAIYNVPLSISE